MSKRRRRLRRHHLKKYAANIIGATRGIDQYYYRDVYTRNMEDANFRDRYPRISNEAPSQKVHLHIRLRDTVYHKLFMFWNEEYTRFYFVKQERRQTFTSISYPSRDRAMRAFKTNKIVFITPASPPNPTDAG